MTDSSHPSLKMANERLFSLDFFRGFTMFLLIAEGTRLFSAMHHSSLEGTWIHAIGAQFHHHEWNGLRFWDLIQPFFMFIVGVAIPFAVAKRKSRGDSDSLITRHAVIRSISLLFMGVMLASIWKGQFNFVYQNVLAQLSVTYLAAYLMMRYPTKVQLIASFGLIVLTDLLYRFFSVEGFNMPFVPDQNFGAWFDMLISGKLSGGHWVSFNAIPTTAHTMWGVLAGQLLMSDRKAAQKLKYLVIAGLIGVVAGYALDPVIPIIKRICTSSFILVSGGWSVLALAFSYWLIDIKGTGKWPRFFAIVGSNSLFIYLFAMVGGDDVLAKIAMPISKFLFGWSSESAVNIFNGLATWFLLWYVCYWLYKRKLFIKV